MQTLVSMALGLYLARSSGHLCPALSPLKVPKVPAQGPYSKGAQAASPGGVFGGQPASNIRYQPTT